MSFKYLSLLFLATTALAVDFGQWSPAGPGDSRGPCPGLNALANHGIIPHDGKDLSVPELVDALTSVFSLKKDLATVLAIGGLLESPNPLGLTYDLADLDRHNVIEHDGSLSRGDLGEGGDDHTFNPDIFNDFMSNFAGLENTTLESAAKGRFARMQNQSKSNPDFTYTPLQFLLSYGETTLYLKALGNNSETVPISWLQTFFADEKLPYDQGWRPSTTSFGFESANALLPKLVTAADDEIPEGLLITKNTIARAFLGLDVLGKDVSSMVQHLLKEFGLGSLF